MSESEWWRHGVVYQVYPRSFADGNGDGIGDIAGVRDRLGYLRDLGVDAVWFSPWYRSPLKDGGYDVSDYRDIAPHHGTLAEADALLAEAHEAGLRILVDLVPNHTSDEHPWFQEVLASEPGDACRERYIVQEGLGPDGDKPPNNWMSNFGGPAWSRLPDGQWYLHLFDPGQPDLDWRHPEVREEFRSILRFWLDRGVDGFRVDVAHSLTKDPDLPDLDHRPRPLAETGPPGGHPHWDRDDVHEIIREWRGVLDEYDERMMVAEAWVRPERLPLYTRPDEYHQSFDFGLLEADWDAGQWREGLRSAVDAKAEVGAVPTWVLSNHDVMRHATRYGLPDRTRWRRWPLDGPPSILDAERGLRRARAATTVLLAMPGSVYLYQGEELGLPEVHDLPHDVLDDPTWERSEHDQKGRDGCRVPIPWQPHGPSFGFGDAEGWLPQPAGFAALAVSQQVDDPVSTLSLYRHLLTLRREFAVHDDTFDLLDPLEHGWHDDVVALRRGSGLVCVANFGAAIELPTAMRVLATSAPLAAGQLPTDAAVWLLPA